MPVTRSSLILLLLAFTLLAPLLPAQGVWSAKAGAGFPARNSQGTAVFNNRLWVVGGGGSHYTNDIWSSADGIDWQLELDGTPWSKRTDFALLALNGRLWMLGGYSGVGIGGGLHNDVWSSPDGVNWTQETNAAWAPRTTDSAVVFNNRIWVFGGWVQGALVNDVWSSPDGNSWKQETTGAQWPARRSHQVVLANGELWLMGGENGLGPLPLNDVWSSSDGISWTQQLTAAPWSKRSDFATAFYNNEIWVLGGNSHGGFIGDVWSSPDGTNWTQQTTSPGFGARAYHRAAVFDNRLWTIAGHDTTYSNMVWASSDGVNWTREAGSDPWPSRDHAACIEFKNKMWMLGGRDSATESYRNDIWSSTDGITWTLEVASAPWEARAGHAVVFHDNQLWLLGGGGSDGGSTFIGSRTLYNDVWSSYDGVNWTKINSGASWTKRSNHAAVVYNGRMYVMGGYSGISLRDVWSSDDGISWRYENLFCTWTGRDRHTAVVYNNEMWLIGGWDSAVNGPLNDVWHSTDGITWTQATYSAAFQPRRGLGGVIYQNKMWIVGGFGTSSISDAWSSTDGITWNPEATTPWAAREGHGCLEFDGRLWVVGGESAAGVPLDVWAYGEPPQITSTPAPTATVGVPYSYNIVTTGYPAPAVSASGLPAWLSLSGNILSGTPGVADVGPTGMLTITAANSSGSVDQQFQITVAGFAPAITSSPPSLSAYPGSLWSYTITATGTPTPVLSVTGNPAWLSLNGNVLSGTPADSDAGVVLQIQITATNGQSPDDAQTFQLEVAPPGLRSDPGSAESTGCAAVESHPMSGAALLLLLLLLAIRRRNARTS